MAAAFYKEPASANAAPLLEAIRAETISPIAPDLLLPEFLNVCRKKQSAGLAHGFLPVPASVADSIVSDFVNLKIVVESLEALTLTAWRLHQDHGIETGDAFFLAVAQQWQAELWTTDAQFFRRASGIYGPVYDLTATVFV